MKELSVGCDDESLVRKITEMPFLLFFLNRKTAKNYICPLLLLS